MIAVTVVAALVAGYLSWRCWWFFRNPARTPPAADGLVSPADGTVVYAKKAGPGEPVIAIKRGVSATIKDIVREDLERPKLVVGIFMSPFNVHYNRAPLSARVGFVRRHPASGGNLHMGPMHWRCLLGIEPRYRGSMHIVQNERTVTQFLGTYRGEPLACYVVQIGARTVNGIESYYAPGEWVERGATFGMIRIGSQVDVVVPWRDEFEALVRPGDRVVAGETLLLR